MPKIWLCDCLIRLGFCKLFLKNLLSNCFSHGQVQGPCLFTLPQQIYCLEHCKQSWTVDASLDLRSYWSWRHCWVNTGTGHHRCQYCKGNWVRKEILMTGSDFNIAAFEMALGNLEWRRNWHLKDFIFVAN